MAGLISKTVTLNNGVNMPILGLGTYRIKGDAVKPVVDFALRHGYRSIDSAAFYRNEEGIGESVNRVLPVLGLKREDIFITTKLPPTHQGTEKCQEMFNTSLKNLNTPYIDLYLIHWPGAAGINTTQSELVSSLRRESWLKMEQLYKEGAVRAIGVSNYTIKHLEELFSYCTVKPAVNQVECHPHLTQKELLDYCKLHGIHLQAYSSLGTSTTTELLDDKVVNEVAKKLNKTPAQVLLRWAIQQGIGVIPKASNLDHVKANHQVWDFSLSDEDVKLLNNLKASQRYCWDPNTVS
ncbi:hypothetical protein CHUAL_007332 [Chamberlinius hualienensis]